jgi:4-amino-4-deoxy-L-arabinose transferase-like glycosyltransferase
VFHVEHPIGVSARLLSARWLHVPLLLVLCALVYWPRIGARGLTGTEGHRVVPAWTILETGEWLPVRLFEQAYMRKPPGMPWAIAAASTALGETEFAARAVSAASATAMTLLVFAFATRWFGAPWGFVAGLAQALLPRLLVPARSAEIEALNLLGAQATALLLIDILVAAPPRGATRVLRAGALAGLAATLMLVVKGPAAAPVAAGAVLGACATQRSIRSLRSPALWIALVVAGVCSGTVAVLTARAVAEEPVITQSPAEFLWDLGRLGGAITLPFLVLLGGAPWSLALLFPLGRSAGREVEAGPEDARALNIARACTLTTLLALSVYMLALVSNQRYGMPALVAVPPVVAWLARSAAHGLLTARRAGLVRAMALGSPLAWPALLTAFAVAFPWLVEPRISDESGRDAGFALAHVLPDGAEVWANSMVEARPEVLAYAERAAAREGRRVRPLWKKPELATQTLPPPGVFLLLKDSEVGRYGAAGRLSSLEEVARGGVHQYDFVLFRVRRSPAPMP